MTVVDRVTNDSWWQGNQWQMVTGWPMTVDDRETNDRWWQGDQWQLVTGWPMTVGDRVNNDRWWQGDQWQMVIGWPMTVGDRVTNNRWWQDDQWQMARDVDWKQDAEGKESNQYRSTGFEPRISKIRNTLINWTDKTGSTVRSGRGLLG